MATKESRGGYRPNSGWRNREKTTTDIKLTIDIELLENIEKIVEKRGRSRFINSAIRDKIERENS